jgi:hypothetical protein
MKWTAKEEEALWLAHDEAETAASRAGCEPTSMECQRRTATAVATCAVELAAARGGTMTATEYIDAMDRYREDEDQRPRVDSHFAALGARNAALEARIDADALAAKANIEGWRDTAKDRAATIQRLEQHVSDLEKSLENVRADRDAALAELKTTKERLVSCETAVDNAMRERDGFRESLGVAHSQLSDFQKESLRQRDENATLKVDNAVLLDGFLRMMSVFENLALEAERSGRPDAAAEHRRSAENLRRVSAKQHPGAALLEEHKRALVRARNEGLEKAAAWHDAVARDATEKADWRRSGRHKERSHQQWEWTATCHKEWAKKIRAMTESET